MVGHTGFLITARRLAQGTTPLLRKRRPAKGAYDGTENWDAAELDEREPSAKKLRRVQRDLHENKNLLASSKESQTPPAPPAQNS